MMMRASETKSSHCYKMLQTVNNFVLIKDNMDFFEKMGVASMLTNMDMAEIETFIADATVEGEQNVRKKYRKSIDDKIGILTPQAPHQFIQFDIPIVLS